MTDRFAESEYKKIPAPQNMGQGENTYVDDYTGNHPVCQGENFGVGTLSAPISYQRKAPPQLYEEIKGRVSILETFQRLGYHLGKLRERGNGQYTCCCPFHGDDTPSLSISNAEGVYHCFACGESGDIIKLWEEAKGCADRSTAAWLIAEEYGISVDNSPSKAPHKPTGRAAKQTVSTPTPVPEAPHEPSLMDNNPPAELPPPVPVRDVEMAFSYRPHERVHSYRGGNVKVIWSRDESGKKRISWYHLDERGQWADGASRIPLYEAGKIKDNTVFVVEGEKDAESVSYIFGGRLAVSLPNGASDRWKPDYIQRLKSIGTQYAIIFWDNDDPGKQYARKAVSALTKAGIACKTPDLLSIWEDMPPKADVTDFIWARHNDGFTDDGTRDELAYLISETPEVPPQKPEPPKPAGTPSPAQSSGDVTVVDDQNPLLPRLRQMDILSNPRYPLNGVGAGYLYADLFRQTVRYCTDFSSWMAYNPDYGVWVRDKSTCYELAKDLANAVNALSYEYQDERFFKFASRFGSRSFREDVLADARSVYPVSADDFDSDGDIINLKNGILRLDTLEFVQHSPDTLLMHCAPVEYHPEATCTLWQNNITEVLELPEKIWYVQKLAGLCLTTDARRNKFDMFLGVTSRNGKSTVCDVLMSLLGNGNAKIPGYAVSLSPETFSDKKTVNPSAPSPDMMQLMGSRLCIVPEPKKSMVLDSEQIKRLTGGNFISARRLHEDIVNFKFNGNLIFDTNYMPKVTDSTLFKSGRCVIVPFSRSFAEHERDETRRERLTTPESLSGILNWCIGGLKMIRASGMEIPEVCLEAANDIWEDSDPVKTFFEENFVPCPGSLVSTQAARNRYEAWCASEGLEPWSQKNFLTALKVYAGDIGRTYICGNRARGFIGFVLS